MQVNVPDPHAITIVLMGPTIVGMMTQLTLEEACDALKAAVTNIEAQIAAQQPPQDAEPDQKTTAVDLPIPDLAPGESATTTHQVELPGGGTLTINHTHTNDAPPGEDSTQA